jgi:hypothetical protein
MTELKKKANEWNAKALGSGSFIICKPKRNKAKLRLHRVKNVRRAR